MNDNPTKRAKTNSLSFSSKAGLSFQDNLRTDAIVLHRTNFSEADRILKVLTPENGAISVMAKSVRKEKARLAGKIELFAVCNLNLHLGKGLATLTGARLTKFYDQIMTDYDRMQFGYEALKQTNKAVEHIDEPEFYALLKETLTALNDLKISLNLIKIWFYLHLANLLGGGLNTNTDNNGMKLVEDANYDFDAAHQVFQFNENGKYDSRHIKFLRVLAQNKPTVLAQIENADDLARDCLGVALTVAKV